MVVSTDRGRDAYTPDPATPKGGLSMQPQLTTSPLFGDSRLPAHFWSKVRQEPCGCWLWQGAQSPYGQFWLGDRIELAHRHAYGILVGPIPEGLEIDHLCRTPPCVNPLHMEAVTRSVNTLRGLSPDMVKARHKRITHCPQGHVYAGKNLRINQKGARECRSCDRERGRLRTLIVGGRRVKRQRCFLCRRYNPPFNQAGVCQDCQP